jgi:hypothetical protein
MDVGCSLWGFAASTMILQHHTGVTVGDVMSGMILLARGLNNRMGVFPRSITLTGWQLLALMSAKFLRSFFGDWYLQRFLSVVSV